MYPALIGTRYFSAYYSYLDSLNRQRHALPDADAHGGQRALAASVEQLMRRGERGPSPRQAERMTKRNRAAVGIHMRGVIRESKLAQACERLGGKGFIEL